jgi:hypothetical protein
LETISIRIADHMVRDPERNAENSLRIQCVVVWRCECGSPGAEGSIRRVFSEAFVEAIVDNARFSGALILVIGYNTSH